MSAVAAMVCPPAFTFTGRESLTQDLNAHVGKLVHLDDTNKLPEELKNSLRNDLAKHSRNDGGIPGLKTSLMDSGASAICMKSQASILPKTDEVLQNPSALEALQVDWKLLVKARQRLNLSAQKGRKLE